MSNHKAAKAALAAYNAERGERDTTESEATDLIADLLIWLHSTGQPAERIARQAVNHFEEEAEPYRDRRTTNP